MAKLAWDATGERLYETGISNVVLYKRDAQGAYNTGIAWNGVSSVSESPDGAEAEAIYADNIKYLNLISAEELGLTLEAYMSPEEFDECDGEVSLAEGVTMGQQSRATFGLSYKTILGNDVDNDKHGYKLHLIYGCQAQPSDRQYETVNDSPEAMSLSWEIKTTPIPVEGYKATSRIIIDSTKADATKLAALEAILYGGENTNARLPLPDEIITLFSAG